MATRKATSALVALVGAIATTTAVLGPVTSPAAAATTVPGDPLTGSGSTGRTVLTFADLTTGTSTAPVDDAAFAVPAQAAPPSNQFEGTLTLANPAISGGFSEIVDTYRRTAKADNAWKHLPAFTTSLVQTGSHLIPIKRGLTITGGTTYNLVVSPGRAWNESTDNGKTRAAIPFAIIERNANCVHNGVLTFLFNASSISNVRYQVTQETCAYQKFNMWGQLSATYTPSVLPNDEQIRNDYAAEVSTRLPTKPLAALASDYPSAGVNTTAFGTGVTPADMTKYGVLVNGANYVSGCTTRFGTYPFCEEMVMPSYSTAKSAFDGVAFMRLAQLYGTSVRNQIVGNLVPETASARGEWSDVTLDNALDMATGNYNLAGYESDEDGLKMSDFFVAETYDDKIDTALVFPRKAVPGTKWIYHSSDAFITARAQDAILKSHQGPGADIFNMLRDDVLKPLRLSPESWASVRTDNSGSGKPFGGYGMFWTSDNIAKMAKLLNNDSGQIGETQVLSAAALDTSMQKNASDRGLTTSGSVPFKYNNMFWAKQFTPADYPQLSCSFWTPFMSGYGGITVAMAPNGATYWYFSDNSEFSWASAVIETGKINPLC
ncbi:hypothetical protein [Pedococcus sp. P5_B7]